MTKKDMSHIKSTEMKSYILPTRLDKIPNKCIRENLYQQNGGKKPKNGFNWCKKRDIGYRNYLKD